MPEAALLGVSASGDIYLNKSVPADLRSRVLEAAKAHYLAHPQVAAVFTVAELRRLPAPNGSLDEWSLGERLRASFDPDHSGDLFVVLKPHVTPDQQARESVRIHRHPRFTLELRSARAAALLPARDHKIRATLPVETVDILPTLASLVGLAIPASEIDGRCLDLDAEEGSTCKHSSTMAGMMPQRDQPQWVAASCRWD